MGEVGKPAGLTKRPGSSQWYFRMRCPAHLRERSPRADFWKSLDTADYRVALTRLEAARSEALRAFQPPPSGIVSRSVRVERPNDPALPLLTTSDAPLLAVAFFRRALEGLDAEPPLRGSVSEERLVHLIGELDGRMAELASSEPHSDDEEDPLVAYETVLLQHERVRAPMLDAPSRLLREYLRRALLQLGAIEKARLVGDYSVTVTDPLFARTDASAQPCLDPA